MKKKKQKNEEQASKAEKKPDSELLSKIILAIRNGNSIHQIAKNFHLTIEESQRFIDEVSKDTREGAAQHRIMLRGMLRERIPSAIKVLVEISNGTINPIDQHEIQLVNLRFKAADKLLQYGSRFLIEDIPTSAVEQGKAEEMIQTIFDFESVVTDDGATTLVAKPSLKLVGNE